MTVYTAIASDVGIAAMKLAVGYIGHSSAMISEGIHSLVDTSNGLLMLLGIHRSRRPADAGHPFGYGLELYFWNLIVAILIFGAGGGLTILQGIHALQHPEPVKDALWSYLVLGGSAVFEGWTCLVAYREFKKESGRLSLWGAVVESKDPTIFTVLYENLAALAGLAVAFLGILLSRLLKMPSLDAAASIVIGAILALVAVLLARESKGLLIGESARSAEVESIRQLVESDPDVVGAGTPLTLQLGPHDVLLNLDVQFRPELTEKGLESTIDRLETAIRREHPDVRRIFLEAESLAGRVKPTIAGDAPAGQFAAVKPARAS